MHFPNLNHPLVPNAITKQIRPILTAVAAVGLAAAATGCSSASRSDVAMALPGLHAGALPTANDGLMGSFPQQASRRHAVSHVLRGSQLVDKAHHQIRQRL